MNALWTYHRVTRSRPCGVCGSDHWCRRTVHADGRVWNICNRVSSDRPAGGDGGGWLHPADGRAATPLPQRSAEPPRLSPAEVETIDRQCRTALTPARLAKLAERLAVSDAALLRLGVGWHAERAAFTFPMRDAAGRTVGIRTRHADGSKQCVTGSRLGVISHGGSWERLETLVITEGESDAAAAIDLGFDVIARPGCSTCAGIVVDTLARLRPDRVVLIADADPPGQNGAHALARRIAAAGTICRVLTPPDGAEDLRAWKLLPESNTHALAALIEAPADRTDCLS